MGTSRTCPACVWVRRARAAPARRLAPFFCSGDVVRQLSIRTVRLVCLVAGRFGKDIAMGVFLAGKLNCARRSVGAPEGGTRTRSASVCRTGPSTCYRAAPPHGAPPPTHRRTQRKTPYSTRNLPTTTSTQRTAPANSTCTQHLHALRVHPPPQRLVPRHSPDARLAHRALIAVLTQPPPRARRVERVAAR